MVFWAYALLIGSMIFGAFQYADLFKISGRVQALDKKEERIVTALDNIYESLAETNEVLTNLNQTMFKMTYQLTTRRT